MKTKKQQKVHYNRLKGFNSRSATTDRKNLRRQRVNREYHKMTLRRATILWKLKYSLKKLSDTGRSEVDPEENNSQNNHSTETQNETVKEGLFETPMGGSTRESKNTNTNNKSRSTRIPVPKAATQQKRDSLVATSERNEGEEFSNRSKASTSQKVTERRYHTRSASGITRPRKLKDYFLFKDNDLDEKFNNDVYFFRKVIRQNAERVEPTLESTVELETFPTG